MDQDLEEYRTETYPEGQSHEETRSGVKRVVFDILETLLLSALLFLAINAISARIRVDGHSMEPTLHTGQFVVVNKLAYRFGSPGYEDVIVFHFPRDPEQEYIKRVIGLPGDNVSVSGGQVKVNGQVLDEPYILSSPAYENEWEVPEDHLFVFGDNRNNSSDSHTWGSVPMDYVVGKAVFIYWPPQDWGMIEHTASAGVK